MRIVIDLQGVQTQSRLRGIGRYTFSLIKSIVHNCGEHEIILVLNGQFPETIDSIRSEFEGILSPKDIRVWESLEPVAECNPDNTWRREAAECIREAYLLKQKPDFVLITTLFEGFDDNFIASIGGLHKCIPTAVILYDLIPLMNPELYLANPLALAWYNGKVAHCKRAQLLLSISESARQEAIKYLGTKESVVVNISTAAEEKFKPEQLSIARQQEIREKFGLPKQYLMYSGATDDRKNHLRLIKAYAKLPRSIRSLHQLAFVGGLPNEHKERFLSYAEKCGLGKDELIISGRVSDNELVALYNLCKAFVFPSWHEGFGLPALEAMMCGRAVIASNTSSLPEVIGNSDALFNPFDEQSIATKIEQVLTDGVFRSRLELHGIERAKKFSWDVSAVRAITAMEHHLATQEVMQGDLAGVHDTDSLSTLLIQKIAQLPSLFTDNDLVETASVIAQNQMVQKKQQLLVDVSELVMVPDKSTGIQRVVRKVLTELFKNPPDGYQVEPVYARVVEGYCYASQFKQQMLGVTSTGIIDEAVESKSGDIFLGLDLVHPKVLKKDFYKHIRSQGVKVFFIVYDLLPILLPKYTDNEIAENFTEWLETIIQGDGAICISESVASDMRNWVKKHDPEKVSSFNISWFHLGADIENSIFSSNKLEGADSILGTLHKKTSFLMVGTVEPRKRHAQTLSAFEQLWAEGVDSNLVIVGSEGWKVESLINRIRHHPELGKRLFWLEGINDEYLEKVYGASSCLIAASEGEGFGLPLIEAAQHKLPIIARDIPVFKEVAGQYAYYFNNDNSAKVLVDAVKGWLVLNKKDKHPKSDEMSWLTWEESSEQLVFQLGINELKVKEYKK